MYKDQISTEIHHCFNYSRKVGIFLSFCEIESEIKEIFENNIHHQYKIQKKNRSLSGKET